MFRSYRCSLVLLIYFLLAANSVFASDSPDIVKGNYKQAYIQYNKEFQDNKTPENYLNMCKVTYYLNDEKQAKSYCTTALNILDTQKTPDSELKSDVLSMLGYIYSNTYHNKTITLDYYNLAKELKEKNENTEKFELARLYLNIGYEYLSEKEYNLAVKYLNKSIDTALKHTEKEYKNIVAAAYNNLSCLAVVNKDYEQAREYADKALNELAMAEDMKNAKLDGVINMTRAAAYSYSSDKNDKKEASKSFYLASSIFDSTFFTNMDYENIKNPPDDNKLSEILNEFPYDNAGNYYMLIKCLKSEDGVKAEKYLNLLLNVNKESSMPYLYAARAFAEANKEVKSLVYSQKSRMYINDYLNKYGNRYIPLFLLDAGFVYLDLNSNRQAKKYFKKALKTDSSASVQIAYKYVDLYRETEKIQYAKEASKYFEKAIKNDDSKIVNIIYLYNLYRVLKEQDKADELNNKYNLKEKVTEMGWPCL